MNTSHLRLASSLVAARSLSPVGLEGAVLSLQRDMRAHSRGPLHTQVVPQEGDRATRLPRHEHLHKVLPDRYEDVHDHGQHQVRVTVRGANTSEEERIDNAA